MTKLGPRRFASPLAGSHFVHPEDRVVVPWNAREIAATVAAGEPLASYDVAGPRRDLFHNPETASAAIVTCGGLCPGLNDVIRAITLGLWHNYGVRRILGYRFGYAGLNPANGYAPIPLDPEIVDDIHNKGGTILGSSRGPEEPADMVEYLHQQGINMLFTIGGDGTQRGAHCIAEEIARRGLPINVIGIPKSIDNDIVCIEKTFGFETAVSESRDALVAAHNEAKGAPRGIGLVKLMGRHSGFIAACAALANSEVDLVLIPEVNVDFTAPGGVLDYLGWRLDTRGHAVVVVAEGACQDLAVAAGGTDPSGNFKLADVGPVIRDRIAEHFKSIGAPCTIKYIDPSYMIRSLPATADDSVFCLQLGQHAAHAAMAGYSDILIGLWNGRFTHVPLADTAGRRRTIDPDGWLWQSVLYSTGQTSWSR